jgi:hypothetical protein
MSLTNAIHFLIQSAEIQTFSPKLIWRSPVPYQWALGGLLLSFILLTITRINTPHFVLSLSRSIYKNRNVEKIVNEELPIGRIANFCLVINFLLCFSIVVSFFLNEYYHLYGWLNWVIAISIPSYLLIAPQLYLTLMEIVSGENHFSKEIKITNRIICEFLGLFGSLFLLIWIFNQHSHWFIREITIYLITITYLYRLFRGFIFAFSKGLPWYYIILYFCTFELLPIYLLFNYISGVYK